MNSKSRLIFALLPLLALGALVLIFASQMGRDTGFVPSVMLNKPVPDFALNAVEGGPELGFATEDLTGKGVILVNVFASWCVPCRDEHPFLMELGARDDVQIWGMNYNDPPANARNFLAELGNPYIRIGSDQDRRAGIEWGVYGVPETFVINNEGIITFKHTGPISKKSLQEQLLPAIEAAKL